MKPWNRSKQRERSADFLPLLSPFPPVQKPRPGGRPPGRADGVGFSQVRAAEIEFDLKPEAGVAASLGTVWGHRINAGG